MDEPLMDQMLRGEPMPFIFLGEELGKRIVFGGAVNASIGRVWEEDNSKESDSPAHPNLINFMKTDTSRSQQTCISIHVRGLPGEHDHTNLCSGQGIGAKIHSLLVAIRLAGGMVRRAWLTGIKRHAESG
jgi:hypothetical protein